MSFDERAKPVLDAAAEHAAAVDRTGEFPREAVDALRETGLLGLTLPESLGGLGGAPADFLSITRAIASRCASTAMIYLMHVCAAQVTAAGTPGGDSPALRAMADGPTCRRSRSASGARGATSGRRVAVQARRRRAARRRRSRSSRAPATPTATSSPRGPHEAASPIESSLYLVADIGAGDRRSAARGIGLGLRGNASAPMTFDAAVRGERSSARREGPGPDARRGAAVVPAGSGRRVARASPRARLSAAVAHVTGAKLEHLGQTLADLPTVRARLGSRADRGRRGRRLPGRPRASDGRGRSPARRSCRRRRSRTRWRSGSPPRRCRRAAARR